MAEKFDPYHEWLGIPVDEQPPNHYRLLSIPLLETSAAVIETQPTSEWATCATFRTGASADSRVLAERSRGGRVCLLRPEKKSAYDNELTKSSPKTDLTVVKAIDSELAEIFRTPSAAGASAFAKRRDRKSRFSPPLVATIIAGAAACVCSGLWFAFSQIDKPSEKQTADAGAAKAGGSAAGPRDTTNSLPRQSKPRPSAGAASAAVSDAAGPKTLEAQPSQTKAKDPAVVSPDHSCPPLARDGNRRVPEVASTTKGADCGRNSFQSFFRGAAPPSEENKTTRLAPPPAEQQQKLIAEIDEITSRAASKNEQRKWTWPVSYWRMDRRRATILPSNLCFCGGGRDCPRRKRSGLDAASHRRDCRAFRHPAVSGEGPISETASDQRVVNSARAGFHH